MAADDSSSDCELIIDETCVEISSDEEDFDSSMFHPIAITSADLQAELFHEDTFACTICNETFKYNVGLICHMEMEHVTEKMNPVDPKKHVTNSKGVKRKLTKNSTPRPETRTVPEPVEPQPPNKVSSLYCDCCKKKFTAKHSGTVKFTCTFCKLRFCWESKYKKHLHRIHKLNAVVVCRLCSSVFGDMTELACHSKICPKREQMTAILPDDGDPEPPPEEPEPVPVMEGITIIS